MFRNNCLWCGDGDQILSGAWGEALTDADGASAPDDLHFAFITRLRLAAESSTYTNKPG